MGEIGRTQVVIHGRTYHLAGADPERTRTIAREVDEVIARFADALPGVERYQLAILTAIHFADEFLNAKNALEEFSSRVNASALRILQTVEAEIERDEAVEEASTQHGEGHVDVDDASVPTVTGGVARSDPSN